MSENLRRLKIKEMEELEQIRNDYDTQTRHMIEDIRKEQDDNLIYWLKQILIELVKINRTKDRP